jgi:hypothetical protein
MTENHNDSYGEMLGKIIMIHYAFIIVRQATPHNTVGSTLRVGLPTLGLPLSALPIDFRVLTDH